MALLETIKAGVGVAFAQTTDLQETIQIFTSANATYNPATGAIVNTESSVSVPAIPLDIRRDSENDVFHSFEDGDEALLVRNDKIGFELAADMKVVRGGEEWILVQAKLDPAKITASLQLRKKK